MSFDTEFDYAKVADYLNGRISLKQNEKNSSLSELSIIGNLPGEYSVLSNDIIESHNAKITVLNKDISRTSNVVSKITIVQNLPSDSKNLLFGFYETYVKNCTDLLGIPTENLRKIHFMRQLVSNADEMIPHVSNLMSDVNMTSGQCNCAASLICARYQPKLETMSFNHVLLKKNFE